MPEPTAAETLATLFPQPVVVQIGDEQVPILPITLGELPALLDAVGDMTAVQDLDPFALLMTKPDVAVAVLAICTRRPASWIDSLPISAAARLLTGILEANKSFFVEAGPGLLAAMRSLPVPPAGQLS